MLFNSIEFAVFLPIVFLLYWFVCGRSARWQNLLLLIASYVFYARWDWRFLGLIAFTTLTTYASGLLIGKYRIQPASLSLSLKSSDSQVAKLNQEAPQLVRKSAENPIGGGENRNNSSRKAKAVSAAAIVLNLSVLAVFKYYNFFASSLAALIPGLSGDELLLNIILPVGISFYTLQALSYPIDVYKGKLEPTKDIIEFAAFVSFFPQLLAGPIGRATNLLPQYEKPRNFEYEQGVDGLRQMLWGLFKKVVVADNCAVYVDQVWASYQTQTGSTLLLAAILYSFQIYGDFSGYSDLAIGTAKLFGIRLPQNFKNPYFSRDIAEFWRRWHISLTSWFREYIYIPLGGSRCAKWKILRNTMIVFLISGLWHGANWTFVAWGAYHGLLLCILILLGKSKRFKGENETVANNRILPSIKEIGQMLLTFGLATVGWIIFRAGNISQAIEYIVSIFNRSLISIPDASGLNGLYLMLAIMLANEWLNRKKNHGLEMNDKKFVALRWVVYLVVFFLIVAFGGHSENFIYAQF